MTTNLRMLRALDTKAYVAKMVKDGLGHLVPTHELGILAGMHLARLYTPGITEVEKEISRTWLRQNGFSDKLTPSAYAIGVQMIQNPAPKAN